MGTRHLIAVYKDGELKVAQYGQWDGHPSGQGKSVLDFLRTSDLEVFAQKVDKCYWASSDDILALWKSVGADGSGYVSFEISDQFKRKFPELHRDTGAAVLDLIQESDGLGLWNELQFAADGLLCEWAYVIDLDAQTFEVYAGFRKDHCEGRFKDMDEGGDYRPVSLITTYPLSDLPTTEHFLVQLEDAA